MPDGQVLEFTNVTKRFNEVTAVSDFSARVEPGAVTAFLGPNGAGKTTTLRILLGQVRATSGTATIGGVAYSELRQPLRTIGSVLEETAYRPRRSASRQLTISAKANGIPLARVDEVLGMVGLDGEGDSRIGGFSLGMRQRLSVAHALLGDPGALVFDEPANGLDPEGIRWMRLLMRRLADEGRTVLVSSHLLSEIEQVADNVLVLSKGHLVLASGIETLADPKGGSVVVDAADRAALTTALSAAGFDVEVLRSGLTVRGGDAGTVGAVAAEAGIALSTLVQRGPTLEDVFIELVRGGRMGPRAGAAASQPVAAEDAAAIGAGVAGAGLAAGAGAAGAAGIAATAAESAEATDGETGVVTEADAPVEESFTDDAPDAGASVEDADAEGAGADADGEETTVEESPVETLVSDESADGSADATDVEAAGTEDDAAESTDEHAPENGADEASAADAPDEAPASDSAEAAQDADAEAPQDADAETASPARSFDEILFGAAAPAAPADTEGDSTGHDVSEVFADTGDGEAEAPRTTLESESPEGEAEADPAAEENDHAGVEFFAELGGTGASEADAATGESEAHPATDESEADPATGESEGEHGAEPSAQDGEDDPRSAAVSSMLAAAARAYYEDEPRDYPQGEAAAEDDGAHWSVASTGVIDTVPLAAPAEGAAEDSADGDHENHGDHENRGDHADHENHGDHGDHGDHADHENHGDHHDSEHHGDQHHG